jgi:hypothetical protein
MANIKTIIINNDIIGLDAKNCNNEYDWDITIDSQQYFLDSLNIPTPEAISDDHAELIYIVFGSGGLNCDEAEYNDNADISKITIDLDVWKEPEVNTTDILPDE